MLRNLYQHHRWANLRLIDALTAMAPEDLARKTPGGFGTIQETLTHFVYNEGRFLDVLDGGAVGSEAPPPVPTLADLRAVADRNSARLVELASNLDDSARVTGNFRGRDFDFPAYIPLFQAYHHAVEHRTNITTILATYDLPVPNLDLWSFNEAGEPA